MRSIACVALLVACSGSDDSASFAFEDFEGGLFQMTTFEADDVCFDGGLAVVFLPEGPGTTNDWGQTTELPAWSELPKSYSVTLQEPFNDMDVTVDGTEGLLTMESGQQTGVDLGESWKGCLVDMAIDSQITIDSADTVSGTAVMATSDFDEPSCPKVQSEPCDITIGFTGARL